MGASGTPARRRAPVTSLSDAPLKSGSYASVVHILRDDSLRAELLGSGELAFNEMDLAPALDGQPLTPERLSSFRERCERLKGLRFSNEDIHQAVLQVAHERPFHPVRSYLLGLEWDGEARLQDLATLISAECTPLNRAMLRKFMISAVARAIKPGCKVDTVLILVGAQGIGKSTFFRVLGGPFFSDTAITPGDKDSLLALHSAWIFEWAELESYQRARSATSVKAFISSGEDLFRPPYARATGRFPRSCIIVGSTNDDTFLTDPTGGRRYWVLRAGRVDVETVQAERDQLWAEAVNRFLEGEAWHLTPEEEAQLREVQVEHEVEDSWESSVLDFASARPAGVTTKEILENLGKPVAMQTRADTMRVGAVLTRAGFTKLRCSVGTDRPRLYVRPTNLGGRT